MKKFLFLAGALAFASLSAQNGQGNGSGAYYQNNSNELYYQNNSKSPYYPNTNQPYPAYTPENSGYYQNSNEPYIQNNSNELYYQNNSKAPYYPNTNQPDPNSGYNQNRQNSQYYQQQIADNSGSSSDGNGTYNPNTHTYTTDVYGGRPQGYSTRPGEHCWYYPTNSVFNAEGGLDTPYNYDAARYRAGLGR